MHGVMPTEREADDEDGGDQHSAGDVERPLQRRRGDGGHRAHDDAQPDRRPPAVEPVAGTTRRERRRRWLGEHGHVSSSARRGGFRTGICAGSRLLRSPSVTIALDPLSLFRLDGRVAVVTGASSGLGDRFARVLDAVGARVVLAARRAERLEVLAAELTDAVVVPCDLGVAEDRERLVATTLDTTGRLDVLVNNAG